MRNSRRDELIDWCQDQYRELNKNLDNTPIINSEELKYLIEIRLDPFQREAGSLLQLSSNKPPYKNPYYWAGYTITGLPK
ncbi:MAG: hypothetical protein AAGE84_02185 [Cyanobacteria bacterium P01_G01_bin.39]